MNKREIMFAKITISYERSTNRTGLEFSNDVCLLVYGINKSMTLKQIAEEFADEMHKYINKEAGYDDYYDRYDPEFLRDVMDALNRLIEQEG